MRDEQSIEPLIADYMNNQLRQFGLDYKLEQEKLNFEIDNALNNYLSKSGGGGGIVPTANCY